MISAHSISSASGAASKPNFAATVLARNFVQLLAVGVVELAAGGVRAEVVLVARQLERRRVVVEPPGQARILRVAEVDAGVLVPVEAVRRERLRRSPCAPAAR